DRAKLTAAISEKISQYPGITVIRREVKGLAEFGEGAIILFASGPLTTPTLFAELSKLLEARLYFYDAVAPIIDAASVDTQRAFWQDRYAKGTPDYLNIAFNQEEYDIFYDALINAETVPPADNEKEIFFESCMPIEELARRGRHTLRFGPMKPKGFDDPRTGRMPYAVLQLRAEDNLFSSYNLVGFQTKMTFPEQKRVLSLIPALENVKILRHGVIHKNHYIFSPECVNFNLSLKKNPMIFAAGQLLGSEGYTEAIATGKIAALNIIKSIKTGDHESVLKHIDYERTMIGSLVIYLTKSIIPMKKFVPMNANFGILNTSIISREELSIESAAQIGNLTSHIKNFIKK
ncbi:MAG TPA: methylenetetrahydrofolate--tRNA-(uracil(54)-C(5))-methyltransferase (FADH(2)-oxidizing) TrmFO, partial [Candidatus Wallbacteria bacterium]|nr:methylenetetrahydrofolate--tRNA-(uracil(54)-C(5))-methyltransferase (FADH(2)-oxidizing) TrmFO [Candidatus Wallbacteria bacterium]